MAACAAANCRNYKRKGGLRFFRFPANLERREIWRISCEREEHWMPTQDNRICEVHFTEDQFEQNRQDGQKRLRPFAVPTIFPPLDESDLPPPKKKRSKKPEIKDEPKIYDTKQFISDQSSATCNTPIKVEPLEIEETKIKIEKDSTPIKPVVIIKRVPNPRHIDNFAAPKISEVGSKSRPIMPLLIQFKKVDDSPAKITELTQKFKQSEQELKTLKTALASFLTPNQLKYLNVDKKLIKKWDTDTISKSWQLFFALGKKGYNYLRSTGYPAPNYSTLSRQLALVEIDFGLLHSMLELLPRKVDAMVEIEKDCSLIIDTIELSGDTEYDKKTKGCFGHVTLGYPKCAKGTHLMLVALQGIKTQWVQILACHVTGPSTTTEDIKGLILEVIDAATSVGLRVRCVCFDLDKDNEALWTAFAVSANRSTIKSDFKVDTLNSVFQVLADGPELFKHWKFAIDNYEIRISNNDIIRNKNLPTNVISGKYIKKLWKKEKNDTTKLLSHLTEEIVTTTKPNLEDAMKYISMETAAALETAVKKELLPTDALTTAWFLELLHQWFKLVGSRKRASSINSKNCHEKEQLLLNFVSIIQQTVIGEEWTPLNTGCILTTISFVQLAKGCFKRGYQFLLGSRLFKDGLESTLCRIRKTAGAKPSAAAAIKVVKLIYLSQFMSDVHNTKCGTDSVDFSQNEDV